MTVSTNSTCMTHNACILPADYMYYINQPYAGAHNHRIMDSVLYILSIQQQHICMHFYMQVPHKHCGWRESIVVKRVLYNI